MDSFLKCTYFLLAFYWMTCCKASNGEIILTEDKPYDIINIKVPLFVLKKAIFPSPPLLKSQATVVIPVQVSNEYIDGDEEDEPINEDNEITVPQINIEEVENPEVQEDVVVQNQTVVAEETQASTEAPVQDEVGSEPPSNDVAGQVFRFPCSCVGGQCGCCTGMILQRLRMNACGNISFVPEDFVFDVRLSVNNATVIRRRVSASDPPPVCFNPRRVPFVQVCAEISNIRIRNRNAFACLDINANIGGFQIFSTSFRCFGLGTSGVQSGLKPKPVSAGPTPVNLFGGGSTDEAASSSSGFISNTAGAILGGPEGIIDGVAEGIFGGDDDGGPLGAIGDVVGDFIGGRNS